MQRQLDKQKIYEIAGREMNLISKDYKEYFVDFHLAQGCEKVTAKGTCNSSCKGECPSDCPLKVAAFQAKENIKSGLRKAPDWGRTVSSSGTQMMNVYENPKQIIAAKIEGSYDANFVREIFFTNCARCKEMHRKSHTFYNCDSCMVKAAFRDKMLKLNKKEK